VPQRLCEQTRTTLKTAKQQKNSKSSRKSTTEEEAEAEAETYVDCWRPPQCEATIRNLVQTRTLRIGELLELHALLESTRLQRENVNNTIPAVREIVFMSNWGRKRVVAVDSEE
jgi:hypothetical protein